VVEVRTSDYAFSAPDTILSGATTLHLVNQGPSQHHLVIFALPKGIGKTFADAAASQAKPEGQQPFVYVGGVTAMSPGRASIARLDLEPGRYVIACLDNDGTAPKLHYEVGMVREFTVQ
jgi:hypothetical protein